MATYTYKGIDVKTREVKNKFHCEYIIGTTTHYLDNWASEISMLKEARKRVRLAMVSHEMSQQFLMMPLLSGQGRGR